MVELEEGKELLLLYVPAGAETPYYYTDDGVTVSLGVSVMI